MVGITIYDVKDNHISNKQVREEFNKCYKFHQSLELQRVKWLKLALMNDNRGLKKYTVFMNKWRKQGGQQQNIRTGLSIMLTDSLHFNLDTLTMLRVRFFISSSKKMAIIATIDWKILACYSKSIVKLFNFCILLTPWFSHNFSLKNPTPWLRGRPLASIYC